MSTLGKIVTVLVVVAAVFVGAMAAGYVKVSTDYRAALEDVEGAVSKARDHNKALVSGIAAAEKEVVATREKAKADVAALQVRIGDLEDRIKDSRDDVANQDTILQGFKTDIAKLTEQLGNLTAESKELETRASEAKARADQYQADNNNLVKEIHEERMRRRDLENQVMQARERLAELEKMQNAMVQTGSVAGTRVTPLPAVNLNGMVTAVEAGTGMVQINLGASDGVVKEMTFLVQRGGRYMADLVVTKMDENSAIGYLKTVQGQVQEGDNVRYNVR